MKIPNVTIQELLEAGVHLGHKTLRWNPKMKKYIFGKRDSIHIIDLTQTLELTKVALQKVYETISNNGKILSFLVLFKYNKKMLNVGLNDKDDIINKLTSIVVKSLIFGSNIGKYTEFKTKIKIVDNVLYNCYIGGIRFYNELNSFTQLRNSAHFKAPPAPEITKPDGTPDNLSEEPDITTVTTKSEYEVLTIQQADLSENFTNYSPSAQLFKNI